MKTSALYSQYVIDGSVREQSPSQILDALCCVPQTSCTNVRSAEDTVIDESLDPVLDTVQLDPEKIDSYLEIVCAADCGASPAYSESYARFMLAGALTDTLWRRGHFKLEELALNVHWDWNTGPVGASSSFYASVASFADYLESLDLRLASYSFSEDSEADRISVDVQLSPDVDEDTELLDGRACPSALVPDAKSWLVYIPFDTCDFRLGGSLLARAMKTGGGVASQVNDADYFIDCYEVLRELVEDGIVIAGVSVPEGGMLKAVRGMTSEGTGVDMDLSEVLRSYEESDLLRVLFAEVPGVLVQIRDLDFDYLDAELLLQDVAFFPLGHPTPGVPDVRVKSSCGTGIQRILDSLLATLA